VRSGNAREISQAKLDFERRNDAELRALHDSIDFAERQALQAYVTAGRIELPQIRRTVFMELACHGKAKSGVEFAAAKPRSGAATTRRARRTGWSISRPTSGSSTSPASARSCSPTSCPPPTPTATRSSTSCR
jgi:hypothetical protein